MTFTEATDQMKNGIKVKQGNLIYFLGKSTRDEPYTLFLKKGKVPFVKCGFKKINKSGVFSIA